MKKKIFSIWSVLLVLVVSLAVLVPGCNGDGACTGDIEVRATLCDAIWEGDVVYKLTGPGATAPTVINGTSVNATHSGVECGDWTCEYVSGGPLGAYFVDITPDPTQEVTSNSTKTFTLNFELEQDAWIECLGWTIDGVPIEEYQYAEFFEGAWYAEVFPCQIIDAHFVQGVYGCEGRVVSVNETSWLHITDLNPPGLYWIYVVNEDCAVNKTALERPTPKKVSQTTTIDGVPVGPGGEPIPLSPQMSLDVETIWELVKEIDYEKSINWLGISVFPFEPPVVPHPCVLFELLLPPDPGPYLFQLVAEAEVELMDDEDVNTQNNNAICLEPLVLTVLVGM